MPHSISNPRLLRRYQYVLLVLLMVAIIFEFLGRIPFDGTGLLEHSLSLVAIICLVSSLWIISRFFTKTWYAKLTLFLASSALLLSVTMRLFRALEWLPDIPVIGSEHASYGPVLELADVSVVSFLVMGFVLVILELSNTRIALSVKSSRLENEMAVRRQAETKRLSLESKLWHAQKAESIGMLAGGIAHDFNNHLMGIMGNADILREDLRDNAEHKRRLETIISASRHASELTKHLLAYAGRGQFLQEPIHLSQLTQELISLLSASAPPNAELHFDLAESLPSVECDHTQMSQVIINLVTNAVESLEGKKGHIRIKTQECEVTAEEFSHAAVGMDLEPGKYVSLTITDPGIGMDDRHRQRIFDPYFSTKSPGRGLGLSTVLGIVKGNDGAIFVKSETDLGTEMKVIFPESALPPLALNAPESHTEFKSRTETVLIADDEATLRKVAGDILSRYGYTIIQAENGQEAIDLFHKHRGKIDLIILDIIMPVLNGDAAYRHIREHDVELPILISSGNNDQDLLELIDGDDHSALLSKPFRSKHMLKMLELMLSKETANTRR